MEIPMSRYTTTVSNLKAGINTISDDICLAWIDSKDEFGEETRLFYYSAFATAGKALLFLSSLASFRNDMLPSCLTVQDNSGQWVDDVNDVDCFANRLNSTFAGQEYSIKDYLEDMNSPLIREQKESFRLYDKTMNAAGSEIMKKFNGFINQDFEWASPCFAVYDKKSAEKDVLIKSTFAIKSYVTRGNEGFFVEVEAVDYGDKDYGREPKTYEILSAKTFDIEAANKFASIITSMVYHNVSTHEIDNLNTFGINIKNAELKPGRSDVGKEVHQDVDRESTSIEEERPLLVEESENKSDLTFVSIQKP